MRKSNLSRFGFAVAVAPRGEAGRMITVDRFRCTQCEATLDMPRTGRNNPEQTAKHARTKGWEADPWCAGKSRCPEHVRSRCAPKPGRSQTRPADRHTHP